ncbi:unnamed protein product [Rhizophagus irregularis]|nr:unnamed protein product [Rhizophagus irregularis]
MDIMHKNYDLDNNVLLTRFSGEIISFKGPLKRTIMRKYSLIISCKCNKILTSISKNISEIDIINNILP